MNLNQVTMPATDVERSAEFYRCLGFKQIVSSLPRYARFECADGGATFSIHPITHPTPEVRTYLSVPLPDSPEHLRAITRMWQKLKAGT